MENQSTFGQRMKKARKEARVKQQELSKKTGIAVTSISRYENDERNPTVDYARKIADILGVDANYLLYGEDGPPIKNVAISDDSGTYDGALITFPKGHPMYVEPLHEQEKREKLLSSFEKLNDVGQEKAVEQVSDLAGHPKYRKE